MRDKVKRFLSILMTALMLVNLLPVGALAEGVMISNSVQSIWEKPPANVYVYVKVTGDKAGLTINPSGWYTIGKSANVPGMGIPSSVGPRSFRQVGVWPDTVLDKSRFTRHADNQKIDLDKITWTEFYIDNGADNYVPAGTYTWHMNGTIDIKQLPSVYTIKYVDYDTKELIHSYEVTGLMGQTPKKITAPDSWQENLYSFYFVNGHPKEQTVDFKKDKGELTFYYKKNTANYTVNYYLNGTTTKVAAPKKGTAALGSSVTESPITVDGYTPVSGDSKKITIKANSDENVINFYYYKNVELTANSDTKTYNGNEQTVKPGYTCSEKNVTFDNIAEPSGKGTDAGEYPVTFAKGTVGKVDTSKKYIVTEANPGTLTINKRSVTLTSGSGEKVYDGNALTNGEVTVSGDGFADGEGAAYDVTGSRTDVGESDNTFTYTLKKGTKADNYDIKTENGTLTVTPVTDKVTVTITGNTASEKYDGTEKTASGYGVSISNEKYTEADFEFKGNAEVKGTDANTYPMGLTAANFTNKSANFTNVEFVVTDGSLTINKRSVTLTSASDSKVYDGTALTNDKVTVGGADGFADGEGAEYNVTGTQTNVGSSDNKFTYTLKKGTKADNYDIKTENGTLTVTPVTDKVTVTITGNTASEKYDGTEKTASGYGVSISNEKYTEADFEFKGNAEVKGTDANTYPMGLTAANFTNKSANFTNVEFVVTDGSLTINKRSVTLTSASDSKVYDGTALTNDKVTVGGADGFADGEGAEYNVTGTQTNVGSSDNKFTYTLKKGTKADNYDIKTENGTLTVTPVTDKVTVTITGNTASEKYDGTEKTASGYGVSISNEKYTEADFEFKGNAEVKGTDANTYPMGLTAANFTNKSANFTNVEFVVTDGSLTINKRSVTLTSASDSKVYDGTALTNDTVTVDGDGFAKDEGATYNVTGSQTDVGESKNTFTYTLNEGTKADNYTITKTEGKLEVTPVTDEVIVTITGKTKTVTYDGKEHSIFGYDVTVSNALYNPKKDMQFNGIDADMTAKGTDAGTYPIGLTAEDFTNISDNFTNVEFVVTDGYVKINPRAVTLTSETAGKTYDGTALEKPVVTVTGEGFVAGEVTDIKATGSVTYVSEGEVTNTITYTEGEKFKADNYTIEKNEGKLSINPVTAKVTVTITEKSGTATYDGKEHIVSGYESMTADNPLYDEDSVEENPTVMWAAKGTNVGEYPVGIVAGDFKNTNANFTNVEFVVVDGTLEITPAQVTLQAPIASKTYDGTPLEATQFGHSYLEGLDFADDFASVILTGSQTLVGSSASLITGVIPNEGKKLTNYNFTFVPGTLTVTDGTGDDPVKPENVVTKTHIPKDMGYNLGEPVTFTISVKNIYNTPKTITLTEKANVKFSNGESVIVFNDVPAGETVTAEATYTITSEDILEGVFRNTVTATFGDDKSWEARDEVETAELDTTLNVTKTSDVPDGQKAALGQKITYTIKVQNAGNVPYTNVKVEDPLTGLTETIETLPVGETRTFTTEYVVTEADVLKGSVLNTATATGDKIKDPTSDEPKKPNGGDEVEIKTFAPITIKPKDVTATYNGAAITGKDVEITSGKLLEGHKLSAAVIGSGVNAGSYELTLDPEKITIVDANNKDVSEMYARTILPGKLIINKRSVLITSQSATKTYDGSALTRPAVTITGDGFVPGELAKAEATGSITKVGSTPNAIRYTTTDAFNAANYSIALSVGTLTVTEKPKPEPRRTFNLTINYVYQNGKRAAASYNRGGLKNGETFDITSPVIAGYTASETVVSGTIYNRDIKVTVIYTADGVNLDDYGVPLGLGNITMNVGDCFE